MSKTSYDSEYFLQEPQKKSTMKDVDNVRVIVRCRPMNSKEKETGCKLAVNVSMMCSILSQMPQKIVAFGDLAFSFK